MARRSRLGASSVERVIAVDPTDFKCLDRLAAIARREGKADRADELHRKKIEVSRLEARYEKLYKRNQTIRDAAEMASLAEQLGQPFEAKVLLTIAIATEPEQHYLRDQLVRVGQDTATDQSLRGKLAELFAKELDDADREQVVDAFIPPIIRLERSKISYSSRNSTEY